MRILTGAAPRSRPRAMAPPSPAARENTILAARFPIGTPDVIAGLYPADRCGSRYYTAVFGMFILCSSPPEAITARCCENYRSGVPSAQWSHWPYHTTTDKRGGVRLSRLRRFGVRSPCQHHGREIPSRGSERPLPRSYPRRPSADEVTSRRCVVPTFSKRPRPAERYWSLPPEGTGGCRCRASR
jgi:hypothetical protein